MYLDPGIKDRFDDLNAFVSRFLPDLLILVNCASEDRQE